MLTFVRQTIINILLTSRSTKSSIITNTPEGVYPVLTRAVVFAGHLRAFIYVGLTKFSVKTRLTFAVKVRHHIMTRGIILTLVRLAFINVNLTIPTCIARSAITAEIILQIDTSSVVLTRSGQTFVIVKITVVSQESRTTVTLVGTVQVVADSVHARFLLGTFVYVPTAVITSISWGTLARARGIVNNNTSGPFSTWVTDAGTDPVRTRGASGTWGTPTLVSSHEIVTNTPFRTHDSTTFVHIALAGQSFKPSLAFAVEIGTAVCFHTHAVVLARLTSAWSCQNLTSIPRVAWGAAARGSSVRGRRTRAIITAMGSIGSRTRIPLQTSGSDETWGAATPEITCR